MLCSSVSYKLSFKYSNSLPKKRILFHADCSCACILWLLPELQDYRWCMVQQERGDKGCQYIRPECHTTCGLRVVHMQNNPYHCRRVAWQALWKEDEHLMNARGTSDRRHSVRLIHSCRWAGSRFFSPLCVEIQFFLCWLQCSIRRLDERI